MTQNRWWLAFALVLIFAALYALSGSEQKVPTSDGRVKAETTLVKTLSAADSARVAEKMLKKASDSLIQHYAGVLGGMKREALARSIREKALRDSLEILRRLPGLVDSLPDSTQDSACTVELPCATARLILLGDTMRKAQVDSLEHRLGAQALACSVTVQRGRVDLEKEKEKPPVEKMPAWGWGIVGAGAADLLLRVLLLAF